MTDQDIWNETALNLFAFIQFLETGEAEVKDIPLIALHNIYMVSSYAYYKQNHSYMRDDVFDSICKYLLENFEEARKVVRHPEKYLDKSLLQAGTGFALDYPTEIFDIHLAMSRIEYRGK